MQIKKYNIISLKSLLTAVSILFSTYISASDSIELSVDKRSYVSGEIISLKFNSASKLSNDAWLGLFNSDVPHEARTKFIDYQYIYKNIAKKLGHYEFKVPKNEGNYEFRVISSEMGNVLKILPITVEKISAESISLSITTKTIKPAQAFDVKITSKLPMNDSAWIGIFKSGSDRENQRGFTSYNYIRENKSDILTMLAPDQVGDYELRVYAAEYGALITHLDFHLGKLELTGVEFSLNKTKYAPDEEIIVKYTGHKNLTDRSWLGLFEAGTEKQNNNDFIDYQYLKPKIGGQLVFKAPSIKGLYQLRLFYNDVGPELLSPKLFSVTSSIDEAYLKKSISEKGRVSLYGIYFDTGVSKIKPTSFPLIKQIAELLKSNPKLMISIEGHTDSQGDHNYNQTLSEKRAAAVRQRLISDHQISEKQLQSKGHGESIPASSNDNASDRAKNRRVELVRL